MIARAHCAAMDARDPLASLRDRFALPEGLIYLVGNSLGATPKAAMDRAREVVGAEWARGLVGSWNTAGWYNLPSRLGDRLASLIGAGPGEVVVTDSTSVNLFKLLAAALRQQSGTQRKVIVTERSNFPTDIYIAQGIAAWLDCGYQLRLIDAPEELDAAIDEHTAVVMLTHVNYRTGYMHDMKAVTARAHEHGALTIWDLAHSAGAVPVDLHAANADYAVGCTYKYLNGGPGSPAYLWIAPRHQQQFAHPLTGWWSHASPFTMQAEFAPAAGIRRALCGTQPIISLSLVECGLEAFEAAGMEAIRAKSLTLTDLFIELLDERCAHHPLRLYTPREHARRGSQVSVAHPDGYAVMKALIERGVVGDYREPEIMRFGFTPLYTRFVDVWDAVDVLADILDGRKYDTTVERNQVT